MNELSLYILDLARNSVAAGAKHICVSVRISPEDDEIWIAIQDDGCGMDEALLRRVADPFTTTRTERRVGLGIPLAKQLCEECMGAFDMESQVGVGTKLTMRLKRSHIDCPPMGSLAETMLVLMTGSPEEIEYDFRYAFGHEEFSLNTQSVRGILGREVPLTDPDVFSWLREYLKEGIGETEQRQNPTDNIAEV